MKAPEKETIIEGDNGIEIVSNSLKSMEEILSISKAHRSTLTVMDLTCHTTVHLFHKKTIPTCSLRLTDSLVSSILQILFSLALLTLLLILQPLLVCRVNRANTLLLLLLVLSTTWEQLMNITMVISLRTILPLILLRYDFF